MTKLVSAGDLKTMLHDGAEIALFDVREAGQFGESHLFFATPLPYSRLELDVGKLAPRKSLRVVLCDDGMSGVAARAAARLTALGYTDAAVLEGGTRAWSEAGYRLFAGVNVPSKTFGELVEHACHTPRVTAHELTRMKEAGKDFFIVDGRPVSEHHKMTIPGSTCCPNAELPLRIRAMVANPTTPIVVNCAGRTRSILGAQTLINFGVPNPVFALENGTQGWLLSGLELEYGSTRRYPDSVDAGVLAAAQAAARDLAARYNLQTVTAATVEGWLHDSARTTYLCDVRTPEEFRAGSLPGALHAPGGQLIQATDQWIAARNSRVVVFDGGEMVRAPVVASWLKQLGYEPSLLAGGVSAMLRGVPIAPPAAPQTKAISARSLHALLAEGGCTVFDVGPSMGFRKAHVPGARWTTRCRIAAAAAGARDRIVLVAEDPGVAGLAAMELREAGAVDVQLLDGGTAAWQSAGYATEATPATPTDPDCIDYLFFVHDRHSGNREAMQQYLAWETGLIAQLDEQEKSSFSIPSPPSRSA